MGSEEKGLEGGVGPFGSGQSWGTGAFDHNDKTFLFNKMRETARL